MDFLLMYLVQILLPVHDNQCLHFGQDHYDAVRRELTERFGGVTAHVRSPAEGFWKEESVGTVRDDIVIFEVMAEHLDATWWATYRQELCLRFRQESLIVRSSEIRLL